MFHRSWLRYVGLVWLALCTTVSADWQPGDGYKMHFPQLPDEQGWDVFASSPIVLADDWECTESGPVTDIHFWGSWRDMNGDRVGDVGTIVGFVIQIWSDIPDPDGDGPDYSRPGQLMWEYLSEDFAILPIDPPTLEAWYDPSKDPDLIVPNDHDAYFQYNVIIPPTVEYFYQTAGTVYWLSVSAILQDDGVPVMWGWKSTIDHWNDDAVWARTGEYLWQEMIEPPRYNEFAAMIQPDGSWGGGTGTNFFGEGWYYYEETGWRNIWFYDNQFDPTHIKSGRYYITALPVDPAFPSEIEIAVNWSTEAWSIQDPPPDGPPLPGVDEGLYIGRMIIYSGPVLLSGLELIQEFTLPVPYNPEWVSIDIRGTNVQILPSSYIWHECVTTSLDLSFVINGHALTGACCFPDGTCSDMTQAACEALVGASYAGDGSACLGDGDGNGVDDACEQLVPTGACCYPDGSCGVTTQANCEASPTNSYAGDGTTCLGDGNSNGVDDGCEQFWASGACCYGDPYAPSCVNATQYACLQTYSGTWYGGLDCATYTCPGVEPTGACCLPNGDCFTTTPSLCAVQQGTYLGDGAVCLGDHNSNGVDDACEEPEVVKWEQPPDLTPTGMDVLSAVPTVLADDFLCNVTGQITTIDIYASWYHDLFPGGPENIAFMLSFHEDIPDPDGAGPEFSRPGPVICVQQFGPGEFLVEPVMQGPEGWYDPTTDYYEFPGDEVCWKYTFHPTEPCWVQNGTGEEPHVYWLDVQALPIDQGFYWGWKSAMTHWNDDAVWAVGVEPDPLLPWIEMRYPPMHELAGQSVDLAFTIHTTPITDTCMGQYPGDFDVDGDIDNDDLLALINHVAAGGPPSANPSNGDVNGDCRVNGYDVEYLTAYLHASGPAPVDCTCLDPYGYCCHGKVGNANTSPDEEPTIGDINALISAIYTDQVDDAIAECYLEADVNQSGGLTPMYPNDFTIMDINLLIEYLYIKGPYDPIYNPSGAILNDCIPAP